MKTKFFAFLSLAIAAFSAQAGQLTLEDCCLDSRPAVPSEMVSEASGTTYLQLSADGSRVERFDYATGKRVGVVFDSNDVNGCDINCWDGFVLSPNEKMMLLYTDTERIYRRSFKANYWVYDIGRKNAKPLSTAGKQEVPVWSSDDRMVAFVRDCNVYVAKIDYGTEVAVTTDGKANSVTNGVPDWVYQEEFGMTGSLTWSADNTMLAFIRWDESEVPLYSLPVYRGACNPKDEYAKYPGEISYKYPVAGERNSRVSVLSYDVETRAVKKMNLPVDNETYVNRIEFSSTIDRLMVNTLNRNQNEMRLYAVNPRSAVAKLVYTDKSKTWINPDLTEMTRYFDGFFVVASERDGYCHLYQYSNAGSLMRQITKGKWEVLDFYGYDAKTRRFYFRSNQDGPLTSVVASIDVNGVVRRLSKVEGSNKAQFSANLAYYVLNHSDKDTPNVYTLYNTTTGKKLRDIETNSAYAERFSGRLPKKEFFTVESAGYTLNGYMIKPSNFDASKRYPVIMYHYSGPCSQLVKNEWDVDWLDYAAEQGYIVACVDGRGTGGRGHEFASLVYKQLGKLESIDQVAAARHMAQLPYVDADRIGIFGWSYGGYETIMAMTEPNAPYRAGIAVAPVTDWRLYDTIYTERFMLTPQQNEAGYEASSAVNRAANLRGRLLIVTGTTDDNVHPANTYEFAARATSEGKLFDMMVYTNEDHFIKKCNVRATLYAKLLDYFENNLKR